ncbi:MAG: hypothetical protein AAB645_02530 [Patescibacteria group bacterium]
MGNDNQYDDDPPSDNVTSDEAKPKEVDLGDEQDGYAIDVDPEMLDGDLEG